jgi:hypothetical protein
LGRHAQTRKVDYRLFICMWNQENRVIARGEWRNHHHSLVGRAAVVEESGVMGVAGVDAGLLLGVGRHAQTRKVEERGCNGLAQPQHLHRRARVLLALHALGDGEFGVVMRMMMRRRRMRMRRRMMMMMMMMMVVVVVVVESQHLHRRARVLLALHTL